MGTPSLSVSILGTHNILKRYVGASMDVLGSNIVALLHNDLL